MTSSNKKPEHRRYAAVTSLGKRRWYWVVWPSLAEIQASDEPLLHLGEGFEKTKAEAVVRALELAGMHAAWIAAKYALIYYRSKPGARRIKRGSRPPAGPSPLKTHEFLYRDVFDPEINGWVSVPHRIVRRTGKFVFVEQRPYSPDDLPGSWFIRQPPTFRLNRKMLEQEGHAFVPATAYIEDAEEIYFTNVYTKASADVPAHRCLQVLDLTWPCTEADVKAAYRKLVKTAHPDGGGSQEAFLALQAAYEQALELCRKYAEA